MNDRFSENEFEKVDGTNYYDSYQHNIGKYIVRLWTGIVAESTPQCIMDSVSDYSEFEVEIFTEENLNNNIDYAIKHNNVYYYEISPDKLGVEWSKVSAVSSSRGLKQSVSNIRKAMDTVYELEFGNKKSKPAEAPCKICTKYNDIGVSECWWCGCSNPV